jgi:hypothetical protein
MQTVELTIIIGGKEGIWIKGDTHSTVVDLFI